jgi:CRISPR type III-A-associated RAMP protein Csm4
MKMKIVKIYPEMSKFHFGYLGLDIDDPIFHSDSLFSTILINFIRKNGEDGIESFVENFPKISSLFYGFKGEKEVLFIPSYLGFKFSDEFLKKDRKIPKKVKFISIEAVGNQNIKLNYKKNLAYLEDEGDDINLFRDHMEEKVSIDRSTFAAAEDKLYNISYVVPEKNTFFYFFFDGDLNDDLKKSIEMIKNFGLGGRINTGSGRIKDVKIEDYNDFYFNGNSFVNLSVVFPKKNELENVIKYKLIERKGWVYNDTKRKNNILGFAEGSLFSKKIEGEIKIENIGNKKIYRYGKAFLMPVMTHD